MKKTFLVVLVTLVCLVGAGKALAASPVWIPGVLSDTEDLVGVRYRAFANITGAKEIYLGIPVLGVAVEGDWLEYDATWVTTWSETNQITFTFGSDTLAAQVYNSNGTFNATFPSVDSAIKHLKKESAPSDINFLQITIANGDTGTTVNFNDVFLNGSSLGSFGGNGSYNWSVSDDTLSSGFTITGALRLLGGFSTTALDQSMLEIKAGYAPPNHPPVCDFAYASPASLWPPNHKFVKVNVLGVTDPDSDPITISIDSIFQDELVNGKGDGNTSPDGKGIGTSSAEVRAERSGSGNGRFYHIGFTADDGKGGSCSGEVTVSVAKSMGKKGAAIDDGALYNSTLP